MLVAMFNQRQYAEAEAFAREQTRQYPKHPLAWKVLGASLQKLGRVADALPAMQKAAVLMPKDHEAFNNLGVTLKDLGKTEQAIHCYRQALALKPDYADAHGNLGAALREQGKLAEALACYKRKLALAPHDDETRHHVDALSGVTTTGAPSKYIEGVFDNYAAKFDQHLTQALGYNVPQRMAELLVQHHNRPANARPRVLDLGCGTGLVGAALQGMEAELIGVDLSGGMLQQARARGIYQDLLQSDLVPMMQSQADASFDIVTSADVFVYVGKLDEVVQETRRLLKPGGLFAFSVESFEPGPQDEMGFKLETSGRYSHAASYLTALAARHGFTVLATQTVTIRVEQGQAIMGQLALWRA
ncbi:tetratricopeptide repeat protein [Aquabacterium sp. NJ1]|uniref:tetratricopeptide repeat protein n=1 Tax=Aquabacterium sp. NJ1 TaxID=1538295 RepID=UPI00068F74F0|nr:tetratricopeptide repeat protein [Aquabacterium sp. NJ1]